MTSRVSTGTTRRQNNNRHSGRVPRLRDQRRGARCEAKQRSCYWRFLILRVWYTTSTLPTGKQLTRNYTWRSCDVCVNQFAENDRKNSGMATVSCITTLRTHTLHILCSRFWAKHGTAQLQQPPYSPDLAPCDFFLIPRFKKVLKGHRFEATEDIKRNWTKTLLDIPKEELAKCFQQWQKLWAEWITAEGGLCWRQLGLKPRKPYLLHVLWSVRILFGQTSCIYIYIVLNIIT